MFHETHTGDSSLAGVTPIPEPCLSGGMGHRSEARIFSCLPSFLTEPSTVHHFYTTVPGAPSLLHRPPHYVTPHLGRARAFLLPDGLRMASNSGTSPVQGRCAQLQTQAQGPRMKASYATPVLERCRGLCVALRRGVRILNKIPACAYLICTSAVTDPRPPPSCPNSHTDSSPTWVPLRESHPNCWSAPLSLLKIPQAPCFSCHCREIHKNSS